MSRAGWLLWLPVTVLISACGEADLGTPSNPQGRSIQNAETYYEAVEGKTADDLRANLHKLLQSRHNKLTYDEVWRALETVDEDPRNPLNVVLFYTRRSMPKSASLEFSESTDSMATWNREHVWSKSRGFPSEGMPAYTDLHHLRPSAVRVNALRSNYFFASIQQPNLEVAYARGNYVDLSQRLWEPHDAIKGDVARILLYMDVRYDGGRPKETDLKVLDELPVDIGDQTAGVFGRLSDLLEWHLADPVDDIERKRNERVFEIQGNRNPFVDRPEWVEEIWAERVRSYQESNSKNQGLSF